MRTCRKKIVVFVLASGALCFLPRESVGAVELSLDRRIQQAAAAYNRGEFLKASGEFKKIADGGDIE